MVYLFLVNYYSHLPVVKRGNGNPPAIGVEIIYAIHGEFSRKLCFIIGGVYLKMVNLGKTIANQACGNVSDT